MSGAVATCRAGRKAHGAVRQTIERGPNATDRVCVCVGCVCVGGG